VLCPDASHTVDGLLSRKAAIDFVVRAVRAAEQNGMDGVEALRINPSFRIDPGMRSWRFYQNEETASAFLEMPGRRRLGKGRLRCADALSTRKVKE